MFDTVHYLHFLSTITSCLSFSCMIATLFFSLYRIYIYFKVDFIKIVTGTRYEYIYIYIKTFISVYWTCHDSFDNFIRVSVYIWRYIYPHLLSIFDLNILIWWENESIVLTSVYSGNRSKMMSTRKSTSELNIRRHIWQ